MAFPLHSRRVRPGRFVKGMYRPAGTLEIYYDECPVSPREFADPFGKMLCFSKRYNLGDRDDGAKEMHFDSWGDVEEFVRRERDAVVVLPLYLYDHSGVAMNTTGFLCPWDSGQNGVIYATREAIREAFGCKEPLPEHMIRAKEILIAEVKEYDDYLRGDVYLFELKDADGTVIESCGGFYGDSGIDAIVEETGFKGVDEE